MRTGPDFNEEHTLPDGTTVVLRHVRPSDEDRRPSEVGAPSGEEGPVDEVSDRLGLDPPVAEQVIDPRIHGHHAIEDARLRVGIELDQDGGPGVSLGHDSLA